MTMYHWRRGWEHESKIEVVELADDIPACGRPIFTVKFNMFDNTRDGISAAVDAMIHWHNVEVDCADVPVPGS